MHNGRLAVFLIVSGVLAFSCFVGCSRVPRTQIAAEGSSATEKSNDEKASKTTNHQSPGPSASPKSEPKNDGNEAKAGDAKSLGDPREGTAAPKSEKGRVPSEKGKGSGLGSVAGALFGGSAREERSGLSPEEAHKKATQLQRAAVDLEKKGDQSAAFEKALDAWQLVREHKQDAACNSLEQQLEPLLARLGEAANIDANRIRTSGKPLQVE